MRGRVPLTGSIPARILCACLLAVLLLLLALPASGSDSALAPRKVTLQFKWTHQFQFAGYYAALEHGFYRDAGLDVTIVPGGPSVDVVDEVLSRRADFGVGTSGLLLDRAAGKPVVVIGVIYQHSPLVLLARADQPTQTLHDLIGQRVMIEPQSADLLAMLEREQIPFDRLTVLPHPGSIDSLLSGEAKTISAYVTDEPFALEQAGVRPFVFTPRADGIDFYGDNVFTREDLATNDPDLARRFREATVRGWEQALAQPGDLIDLIQTRYPASKTREQLQFEARRSSELIHDDLIRPGYMRRERWEHIADTYLELGMLRTRPNLDAFMFRDRPAELPAWVWPAIVVTAGAVALLATLAYHFSRINLRLTAEIAKRQEAQQALAEANALLSGQLVEIMSLRDQLREQVIRDPLTGLFNRRYLDEALDIEIARARRSGHPLSVVILDVDRFKQINDSHGHLGGGEALKAVASLLAANVRAGDVVCRYGGDELVLVLPEMSLATVLERAERWRRAVEMMDLLLDGKPEYLTISLGVATFPHHGHEREALLQAADQALYEAKANGRNRVGSLPVFAELPPALP